jgi:hypothetical protein
VGFVLGIFIQGSDVLPDFNKMIRKRKLNFSSLQATHIWQRKVPTATKSQPEEQINSTEGRRGEVEQTH